MGFAGSVGVRAQDFGNGFHLGHAPRNPDTSALFVESSIAPFLVPVPPPNLLWTSTMKLTFAWASLEASVRADSRGLRNAVLKAHYNVLLTVS